MESEVSNEMSGSNQPAHFGFGVLGSGIRSETQRVHEQRLAANQRVHEQRLAAQRGKRLVVFRWTRDAHRLGASFLDDFFEVVCAEPTRCGDADLR